MSSSDDRSSKPVQQSLLEAPKVERTGPPPGEGIEVFGKRFKDEDERRAHFKAQLAEKLGEPGFRDQPGFPVASDEDILRMSDPPWYTACPNPFLAEFVKWYGKKVLPGDSYAREPLAVDTQVGKTDALYKAHGYHTKVPHLAIVPSILHYTEPGDIVLDGFCGSGLMGVAAQWCGSAPQAYRSKLEEDWRKLGLGKPKWGVRRAVLNDLSPAATFIAQGFNLPFDVARFEKAAERLLADVEKDLGWMYETTHTDGTRGSIEFTVWSDVFACADCTGEIVFVEEALDDADGKVRKTFPCPHCGAEVGKRALSRVQESVHDPVLDAVIQRPLRRVVAIHYTKGSKKFKKRPDATDVARLAKIQALPIPSEVPKAKLPYMHMTHERARMDRYGVTHLHHFFLPRALHSMSALWRRATLESDDRLRNMLLWFVEQSIWGSTILNRYSPTHFSQVNRAQNGVYYIPSQISECSPRYMLGGKASRIVAAFGHRFGRMSQSMITTGTATAVGISDASIDYIFTDPPFGENIYYADLNYLVESWHRAYTASNVEAIVDHAKKRDVGAYGRLMLLAFREYHRALKPGRWMTMVFSNSHNAVWNAVQEALGEAGFVVADVRMLDKTQGSYRQVTSTAVKADLVVSCYKPSERLERRIAAHDGSPELAWAFVREHLAKVIPTFESGTGLEVVVERTADSLYDRLVAICLQRHISIPLSKAEFIVGLDSDSGFAQRDGMWFLPGQVDVYDKKRSRYDGIGQVPLIVTDESTAIRWLRAELSRKPQQIEDLYNPFKIQSQHWARSEQPRELRDLLRENFLQYEEGEIPGPIHAYLSSAYHDLRSLPKDHPALIAKALNRWYVADPNRAGDLEKRRKSQLLKEFEAYITDKRKRIDVYRRDAVVTGFQEAYRQAQWARIITVASKLPAKLFEDDFELYMLLENAKTQAGVE